MNKKGFTLVELLVVIMIVGVLTAVALPQYFKAVEKSKCSEAVTILRDISSAQHSFFLTHNEYSDNFDSLDINFSDIDGETINGDIMSTSNFDITPFLHQKFGEKGEKNLAVASRIKDDDTIYAVYIDLETGDFLCEDKNKKDNITCSILGFDGASSVQICESDGHMVSSEVKCPVSHVCPNGQSWLNDKCTCLNPPCKNGGCPDEYCWNGTECIRSTDCSLVVNLHTCPSSYSWNDSAGKCECKNTLGSKCPDPVCNKGRTWNGTECVLAASTRI
ncbi:MAG: prepilin-type N-terminal cleavage/methylation domain-containing protein [Elusimicrobiaceae bacterium]|nr:prepilin-type N-terminal cleavage/methylation domain-containing protein [Elusimicrobiaceae bacterium]